MDESYVVEVLTSEVRAARELGGADEALKNFYRGFILEMIKTKIFSPFELSKKKENSPLSRGVCFY